MATPGVDGSEREASRHQVGAARARARSRRMSTAMNLRRPTAFTGDGGSGAASSDVADTMARGRHELLKNGCKRSPTWRAASALESSRTRGQDGRVAPCAPPTREHATSSRRPPRLQKSQQCSTAFDDATPHPRANCRSAGAPACNASTMRRGTSPRGSSSVQLAALSRSRPAVCSPPIPDLTVQSDSPSPCPNRRLPPQGKRPNAT